MKLGAETEDGDDVACLGVRKRSLDLEGGQQCAVFCETVWVMANKAVRTLYAAREWLVSMRVRRLVSLNTP